MENTEYKMYVDSDPVCEGERAEVCDKVIEYIEEHLNERERDIFYGIVDKTPRNSIAKKYRVSFTRMKQIHHKIIKKLRAYLTSIGIGGMNDI